MAPKSSMATGILITLLVLGLTAKGAVAQGNISASGTLSYSGILRNDAGRPVPDGVYAFTFALYDAMTNGNLLWSEAQPQVTVKDGNFTALLGRVNPLPNETRISERWLAVSVQGPGEGGLRRLSHAKH